MHQEHRVPLLSCWWWLIVGVRTPTDCTCSNVLVYDGRSYVPDVESVVTVPPSGGTKEEESKAPGWDGEGGGWGALCGNQPRGDVPEAGSSKGPQQAGDGAKGAWVATRRSAFRRQRPKHGRVQVRHFHVLRAARHCMESTGLVTLGVRTCVD